MLRKLVFPLIVVSTTSLTACGMWGGDDSYIRDRQNDYLTAPQAEALRIPEDLDKHGIDDYYVVPPTDENISPDREFEAPRPMPLAGGDMDTMVKIQKLDQKQWILVRLQPGQVWPRLRDFLFVTGIGVAVEDAKGGIIETTWLTKDEGDPMKEAYRLQVVQGLQRNSSEIHVLHYEQPKDQPDQKIDWQPVSINPERERVLVDEFSRYLAETAESTAAVSLKAQGIDTSRRMYLVSGEDPHLKFSISTDRAWATTGFALQKAGFAIDDMNSGTGIFYTTYNGPPEEEGKKQGSWWSALTKPFGSSDKGNIGQYRFILQPSSFSDWMELRITPEGEGSLSVEQQEALLNEIKAHLT
ncbi:MAG: outer membrane protein assembly factor BamC [Pseudomonadales bacterium]